MRENISDAPKVNRALTCKPPRARIREPVSGKIERLKYARTAAGAAVCGDERGIRIREGSGDKVKEVHREHHPGKKLSCSFERERA